MPGPGVVMASLGPMGLMAGLTAERDVGIMREF
jgi:hypothetical protein